MVEVVPTGGVDGAPARPVQIPPPITILIEDIDDPVDGFHQHIDFIYVCRPTAPVTGLPNGWRWVTEEELASGAPLSRPGVGPEPLSDDVRVRGGAGISRGTRPRCQERLGVTAGPSAYGPLTFSV